MEKEETIELEFLIGKKGRLKYVKSNVQLTRDEVRRFYVGPERLILEGAGMKNFLIILLKTAKN